jgi:foldase protein PrsA
MSIGTERKCSERQRDQRVGLRHRGRRRARALVALTAAAALVAALSACGSSSNEAVVQVAGATPITKGLIAHWIPIEAVLSYNVTPIKDVPAGVIPDPPQYTKCMAFLKANPIPAESAEGPPTPAKLKARCQSKERKLREKVLRYMIAYRWEKGELAQRGLSLSSSELNKALRFFETYDFTPGEFHAYLAHSKETREDLRIITEINVMGTKLQERALFKKGFSPERERHELADMVRRWAAKTTCKAGYVVAGCKQYHGPETPL